MGPAESTGKSSVTYWPGGTRPGSASRRRPRNPREIGTRLTLGHPAPEGEQKRPRRIADDLAWLRQAYDEPEENGLTPLRDTAAVAAWEPDAACSERLLRLRERRVLDAAGFLLHTSDDDEDTAAA